MSRRGKTACIISAALLIVSALFVSFLFFGREEIAPAGSLDELLIRVSSDDDTSELITLWHSESDGKYYAFLPYLHDNGGRAYFYNSGSGLLLDGERISGRDDLTSLCREEGTYHISYAAPSSQTEEAELEVRFLEDIPKFFLRTDSGSIEELSEDKGISEPGFLTVVDACGRKDYSGKLESVHLRGNSSFFAPKKSFTVGFAEKGALLDLGASEKWYFLAQYMDMTKAREMLASRYMEDHTEVLHVDFRYADLYINGEYAGLYLIGKNKSAENLGLTDLESLNRELNGNIHHETVITGDDNVHAFAASETPEDHTGGYILEVASYSKDLYFWEMYPAFCSSLGYVYRVKSPENASLEEVRYIKGFIDEMEAAIYSPDGINPVTGRHFSEYLDIDEWADYYLVKEGFMDNDILMSASVFMSKDSDSVNSKLRMGPVWDIDTVFGTWKDKMYAHLTDAQYLQSELIYSERLLEYDEVRDVIAEKIRDDLSPWVRDEMEDDLAGLYEEIGASYASDLLRWPDSKCYSLFDTVSGNASSMTAFMDRRAEFLESVFIKKETWHRVYFTDNGQIIRRYMVKDGDGLKFFPKPESYLAFFAGWSTDADLGGDPDDIRVYSDLWFDARWIDATLLLEGDTESISRILEDTDHIMIDVRELRDFADAVEELYRESTDEND